MTCIVAPMQRRADACCIRVRTNQMLEASGGPVWTHEGAIRAALGNTPDTSKGLRKCVA